MDKDDENDGSCGKPLSFVSLKVCDPLSEKTLGPNQIGEIRIKSPMVMKGYYRNKKATEESFAAEGWLKSGDLGYFDQEGYVYIVDRLKEIIKYKGFQVLVFFNFY